MLKEIRKLQETYMALHKKGAEYIDLRTVINDLCFLMQEARLKHTPKKYR